jgi:hypothetical protein
MGAIRRAGAAYLSWATAFPVFYGDLCSLSLYGFVHIYYYLSLSLVYIFIFNLPRFCFSKLICYHVLIALSSNFFVPLGSTNIFFLILVTANEIYFF